jgi:toxin HigB-1
MIVSFRNKALERFWWKGNRKGVRVDHVPRLTVLLSALEASTKPEDMNVPGFAFHGLTGEQRYAVKVNKNWRVTFGWSEQGADAVEVDYEDYH